MGPHHGGPGGCGALAAVWMCALLVHYFQSTASNGEKENLPGDSRSDLSDGGREPHLGCNLNTRRALDARIQEWPTDHDPTSVSFLRNLGVRNEDERIDHAIAQKSAARLHP